MQATSQTVGTGRMSGCASVCYDDRLLNSGRCALIQINGACDFKVRLTRARAVRRLVEQGAPRSSLDVGQTEADRKIGKQG